MSRYCNRDGCGHEEEQHLPTAQGGCFGRNAVTGHICLCAEFMAADAKPPSVPPLRVVSSDEQGPLPVRNRAEALERAAACRRTFATFSDPLEKRVSNWPVASIADRPQEHTIIEPGAKIMLAGKPREMSELHAMANTIVAHTNAEDLAAGAFMMRASLTHQASEILRLRAELEAGNLAQSFQNAIAMVLELPHTTHRNTLLKTATEAIRAGKHGPIVVLLPHTLSDNPGFDAQVVAAKLREALEPTASQPNSLVLGVSRG